VGKLLSFTHFSGYDSRVDHGSLDECRLNAEKSLVLASALFPDEEWVLKEPNVWVAKNRLPEEYREPDKWEREMSQVRILTDRGSAAYFLPELEQQGETGQRCADLVLDGEIVEMKQVSGTRATLGTQFKYGYKQGALLIKGRFAPRPSNESREGSPLDIQKHSVFIWLLADMSVGSVKAKIAGELKNRPGKGSFICYFDKTGELHNWTYDELRGIIGCGQKKSPGPA
jgi:hypothetical protein